jgi:AcrR family transcriptional regulator
MPRLDKRQAIMHAAQKLFTSRPVPAVTTDDIAKAARVGKGTLYKYFKDKDDLFFQTATAGFDELCAVIRRGAPGESSFRRQLSAACVEIITFFQNRRRMFGIMQNEDRGMPFFTGKLQQRWVSARASLVTAVAEVMKRGIQEGQVRQDIEPEVLAGYLLGMLRARARDLTTVPEELRSPDKLLDLFWHGAAADLPASAAAAGQVP